MNHLEHYAEVPAAIGHVFKSQKACKYFGKCRLGVTINAYKENNHDILKESLNRLCDLVTALKEFAYIRRNVASRRNAYGLEVCQTFIDTNIEAEYVRSVINAYLEKGNPSVSLNGKRFF